MINRTIDEKTLNFCKLNNIQLFGYQPLESGLLTGSFFQKKMRAISSSDWRSRSTLFKKESITQLQELNKILTEIAYRFDVSIATVSLSWTLQSLICDRTLIGIRTIKQLNQLMEYEKVVFTSSDLMDINNLTNIIVKNSS